MDHTIQDFTKRQYMVTPDYEFFHYCDTTTTEIDYHNHDFYEIFCLISGNVSYVTEGKSYDLSPGDIVLIDNKDLHRPIVKTGEPYERIVFWINPDYLIKESTDKSDLRTCFESDQLKESHLLATTNESKALIWKKVKDFEYVSNNKAFGSELLKKLYLVELIVHINQVFIETYGDTSNSQISSNEKINEIIRYIAENIDKDLTLDHISGKFYISKYHLVRLFKKYTGFTLHKYIMEKRLVYAKALLRSGKNVSETSMACGFRDYSNFVRTFKKSFNVSPKQYFKQIVN